VSAPRAFARLAPPVLPAVDRGLHRLTGGTVLLSTWLLPCAVLTSTGARTGRARRTPPACMPEEDGHSWIQLGPASAARATRRGRTTCSPVRTP